MGNRMSLEEARANARLEQPIFPVPHHYTDAELVRIYRWCNKHQSSVGWWLSTFIVRFLLGTGLRVGEAFPRDKTEHTDKALNAGDCSPAQIDEPTGRRTSSAEVLIRISNKTNIPRRVVVAPWLEPYFLHHKRIIEKRSKWFFPATGNRAKGQPLGQWGARDRVMRVLQEAGVQSLKSSIHHLRTTYACWTAQLERENHPWGLSQLALKSQLGHKPSGNTTDKYYMFPLVERLYNPEPPLWPDVVMEGLENLPDVDRVVKGK